MSSSRRLSQAISEGDGISLLADVATADEARAAEEAGAEGIVVRGEFAGVRDATSLPILWCAGGSLVDARGAGADAVLLVLDDVDDADRLEDVYAEAVDAGVDCVVSVRDEDVLRQALDRFDPEIFLLAAPGDQPDGLERVLALLPDVPAGKLAVAQVDVRDRDEVAELERAGVDGVVVPVARVAALLTAVPPAY